MKPHELGTRLRRGDHAFGTFATALASPALMRLASAAGAEFIVIDMEHTGRSIESTGPIVAGALTADLTAIVRVPDWRPSTLAPVLDLGAQGLMVPGAEEPEAVVRFVEETAYPPDGRRGAGFLGPHDSYGSQPPLDAMRTANEAIVRFVQIETVRGVEASREIAAVPGVDVIWIGQVDLSISLGVPFQYESAQYRDAVARVVEAAATAGVVVGQMAPDISWARARIHEGFRCIAFSTDGRLYRDALAAGLRELKAAG